MRLICRALIIATLTGSAAATSAQPMKPGLWEVTNKMTSASGEVEKVAAQALKSLEKLPPNQRKALETSMAKLGMVTNGGNVSMRLCVTQEMADQDAPLTPGTAQEGDCRTSLPQQTGDIVQYSFTCANPSSHGYSKRTLSDSGRYVIGDTKTVIVETLFQGGPEKVKTVVQSQLVSANCGKVKPLAVPKK